MAEKYDSQIIRFDSASSFFEVLNSALPIGKLQINFINYDKTTNKQKDKLEIYMDTWRAVALADDILSGRLDDFIAKSEAKGSFNDPYTGQFQKVSQYSSYFTDMGGIKFHKGGKFDEARFNKYKAQFAWMEKDKDISRQLKIQKSTKYKYVLRAEYGLGHEDENGLVVPEGMAKVSAQVPLTQGNAIEFAIAIKMSVEAYLNQYYAKFNKDLFPNQKVNVYKPTSNT